MKIGIIGSGAMGQLFGAKLSLAGQNVKFFDVSRETIDSLNSRGITIKTPNNSLHIPVNAMQASESDEELDLAIIFTKGFHTDSAVESIMHLMGARTIGLTLQNGVGNERALVSVLGNDRTLIGMTDFPADRSSGNIISTSENGHVVVGNIEPGGPTDVTKEVAQILDNAGLNAVTHPDVRVPIWEKLIFNTVLNTIGGATGITVGQTGDNDTARKLADVLLEESLQVARTLNISVSEKQIRESINTAFLEHGSHKTSMTVDVELGRRTEIDSIGGAVAELGAQNGQYLPVLQTLSDVVRLRSHK